jgi:hypothetical protein
MCIPRKVGPLGLLTVLLTGCPSPSTPRGAGARGGRCVHGAVRHPVDRGHPRAGCQPHRRGPAAGTGNPGERWHLRRCGQRHRTVPGRAGHRAGIRQRRRRRHQPHPLRAQPGVCQHVAAEQHPVPLPPKRQRPRGVPVDLQHLKPSTTSPSPSTRPTRKARTGSSPRWTTLTSRERWVSTRPSPAPHHNAHRRCGTATPTSRRGRSARG